MNAYSFICNFQSKLHPVKDKQDLFVLEQWWNVPKIFKEYRSIRLISLFLGRARQFPLVKIYVMINELPMPANQARMRRRPLQ